MADNPQLAGGSDKEFASWLAWEAAADQLQAIRPVQGVCYVDRLQVSHDRLAEFFTCAPNLLGPVFDLSNTDFIDHRAPLVLDQRASENRLYATNWGERARIVVAG